MIMVREELASRRLAAEVSPNDAYNICVVLISNGSQQALIMGVYRAPWATVADAMEFCDAIDSIIVKYKQIFVFDDFNPVSCTALEAIHNLVFEHSLSQIVSSPTRGNALFDLAYVSSHFAQSTITDLPPIAGSDHNVQFITFPVAKCASQAKLQKIVDYDRLQLLLSQLNGSSIFSGCSDSDEYAGMFTSTLSDAIAECTSYKPVCRRELLPRHIVNLIGAKNKKWAAARLSGYYAAYKAARRIVRAAIRSHRRNLENRFGVQ